jgi:hypothetical protein
MHGSAFLGETSLGQELSAHDRVKVICVRRRNDSSVYEHSRWTARHDKAHRKSRRVRSLHDSSVRWRLRRHNKTDPGKRIDLGTFGDIAYNTVKPDGYHLVVTLTPSEGETPVRSRCLYRAALRTPS